MHESYAPFLVNNQGFGDGSLGGYMVPTNKQAQITAKQHFEVLKAGPLNPSHKRHGAGSGFGLERVKNGT